MQNAADESGTLAGVIHLHHTSSASTKLLSCPPGCRCKPPDARLLSKRLARCGHHPLLWPGRQQAAQAWPPDAATARQPPAAEEAPSSSPPQTGILPQLQQRQGHRLALARQQPLAVPQSTSLPPPCQVSASPENASGTTAATPLAACSIGDKLPTAAAATPRKRPAPCTPVVPGAPQKRPASRTAVLVPVPPQPMVPYAPCRGRTGATAPPCKVLRYDWASERR